MIYFPATYSFFPVWNAGRLVVTMHDTLPLSHPELVFPSLAGRMAWRLKEQAAARWADRIVTVSEASRRAIQDWLGRPDRGSGSSPRGPTRSSARRAAPSRTPSSAATASGRANATCSTSAASARTRTCRGWSRRSRSAGADVRLVLTGDVGDVFHTCVPELRAAIERHGLGERVLLTGFVPDEDLVFLYGRAYALVQPSLMEGFGLPAVEAMACGTPVISSRAGSLPEVIGEAGPYLRPDRRRLDRRRDRRVPGRSRPPHHLARRAPGAFGALHLGCRRPGLLACFDELDPAGPARRATGLSRARCRPGGPLPRQVARDNLGGQ